jgi:hypothetical protein
VKNAVLALESGTTLTPFSRPALLRGRSRAGYRTYTAVYIVLGSLRQKML